MAPPEGKGDTGQNQGLQTHTRRAAKNLKWKRVLLNEVKENPRLKTKTTKEIRKGCQGGRCKKISEEKNY